MNILAIDTSSGHLCLAVAKNDTLLFSSCEPAGRELSRQIIPYVDKAIKKAGISLGNIDYFACGLGPGSFTGLRIGLATLKGLAFAGNKPIIGVGSLDILAQALKDTEGLVCPVVDARRCLVYSALYRIRNGRIKRAGRYLLVSLGELLRRIKTENRVVFTGDAPFLYRNEIKKVMRARASFAGDGFRYPDPGSLLELARQKIRNKELGNLHKLVPLYLYPKECQINRKE